MDANPRPTKNNVPEPGSNSPGRKGARCEVHPEESIRLPALCPFAYRYAIMAV